MDDRERMHCELTAHMFRALANPMRIFLLDKLRERPWCVCELAAEAGIGKSVASKHLSMLKEAGLVESRKVGTENQYSLAAPCVIELASCAEGTILTNRKKSLYLDSTAPDDTDKTSDAGT